MSTRNLYEVATEVGVVLLVTALNPYVRTQLYELAAVLYPDPDPSRYEYDVPNAAVPLKTSAMDDPAYQQLYLETKLRRLSKVYELMLDSGVVVDTTEGKAVTLEAYADELQQVRRVLKLEGERDDFLDLVKYVLLRSGKEIKTVADCATNAITQEEMMLGIRTFPYHRERRADGTHTYRKAASHPD